MGSVVADDLISREHQLLIVDTIFENHMDSGGDKMCADLSDPDTIRKIIRNGEFDLAICCLPASLGYNTVRTCIEEGLNCVDMSFTDKDMSELNRLAHNNQVLVLHDVGFAPGIPNLIISDHLHNNVMGIDNVKIFAGGVARNSAANKYGYIITWSLEDLESEFYRPARYKEVYKIKSAMPLEVPVELVQVGPHIFESFVSDGVRSLLNADIRNVVERTLRWPGHVDMIKQIKVSSRSKNIRDELSLFCKEGEDMVVMRVDVDHWCYEMIVYARDGVSAMARCTAGTCAAVAEVMLSNYKFGGYGVRPLEKTNIWEKVELKLIKRGIRINSRNLW